MNHRSFRKPEAVAAPSKFERAFQDMEGGLNNAFHASIIAKTLADDALGHSGSIYAEAVQRAVPELAGYRVFVLTDNQWNGLLYALGHLDDMVRENRETYYRTFGETV